MNDDDDDDDGDTSFHGQSISRLPNNVTARTRHSQTLISIRISSRCFYRLLNWTGRYYYMIVGIRTMYYSFHEEIATLNIYFVFFSFTIPCNGKPGLATSSPGSLDKRPWGQGCRTGRSDNEFHTEFVGETIYALSKESNMSPCAVG